MSEIPPGWFTDPADPSTQRYWDGDGWLGKALPADMTPPDGPPVEEPAPDEPPVAPGGAGPQVALADTPAAPSVGPPPGWTPHPNAPAYGSPPPGSLPGLPMSYGYQPQLRPHGLTLAGLGPRLVARIIDIFAVLLLNVVVNGWFVYQWVQEFAPIWSAGMADPTGPRPQPTDRLQSLMLAILVIATALWLAYEVPAIGTTGQTLGKRIMGIRVVRVENLDPIGYGRALRRWARLGTWTMLWWCYGVGLVFQLIDSASVLFDPALRQALHDKTAHTVVVEASPADKPGADVPDDDVDSTGGAR